MDGLRGCETDTRAFFHSVPGNKTKVDAVQESKNGLGGEARTPRAAAPRDERIRNWLRTRARARDGRLMPTGAPAGAWKGRPQLCTQGVQRFQKFAKDDFWCCRRRRLALQQRRTAGWC